MNIPITALYRNPHHTYNVFEILDNTTRERYVRIQEVPCHEACSRSIDTLFVKELEEVNITPSHQQFRVAGIQNMVANNQRQIITLSVLPLAKPISEEAKTMAREYAQTLFPGYEWTEK
jgi:hypothetical protein